MNYALIALGLTLIFAIMGVLNFAHGQMYVLGGFITYYVVTQLGLGFFVGLIASVIVLALVGLFFERVFFRRMRTVAREESTMLLAVGTAQLLESAILIVFREKQRSIPAVVSGVYEVFGMYIPAGRAFVFGVAFVALVKFILFMQHTRPVRALRAIAQDREVSTLQGVNIDRYSALGFAIGAGLTGLAGSLLVSIFAVNSGMGTSISIKAFVLGFSEAAGYAYIPGQVTYLLIFIALIVFLALRPHGIMGKPWG